MARRSPESGFPRLGILRQCSASTRIPCSAVRMLRDEGLLEVRSGRPMFVAGTPERRIVTAEMKELSDLGHRNGYRREELLATMERLA
jgi:DNA-binding FadR family transcriptional regulator